MEGDSGARQSALVGEAPYCSSVTCRPHVTGLPDSSFCCIRSEKEQMPESRSACVQAWQRGGHPDWI
jgi:hypothetical protein